MRASVRMGSAVVAVAGLAGLLGLAGCGSDEAAEPAPSTTEASSSKAPLGAELAGRYAHYDVVAYESADMKTLIVSFGFTDLKVVGDDLVAKESFCHADHRSDMPVKTTMSDAATSAIKPVSTPVTVTEEGGKLRIQRPETPTGIGIHLENPATDELPTDPNDPRIADDDGDGNPGVTAHIYVSEGLEGDLFIARRERFAYDLTEADEKGVLTGEVTDKSEQLIVGATDPMFITKATWVQVPDLSKSPMILKKVDADWDCTRLMAERDDIFPPTPEVDW